MKKAYPPNPQFIADLRREMARLRATVEDLSLILELSPYTIYHWLRGRAPHPLMQQAVIYKLTHEKDCRFSAKEIEAALRSYRKTL